LIGRIETIVVAHCNVWLLGSAGRQSRYRGRQSVYRLAMRSPTSLHENRVYAKINFDDQGKRTFATKSNTTGREQAQQIALFDHLASQPSFFVERPLANRLYRAKTLSIF
jgi:hypothetical protein